MPIGFQDFQLVLAGVMMAGLLILLVACVPMATHARFPRLSVVLILVPLVGIVWLCLVANAMPRVRHAREDP